MAACALQGGMSLANAKLGAVHSLARAVGGIAHVPHGIACAALLTPVIETNVRALRSGPACQPAVDRYDRTAQLLTGQPAASIQDGLA
jgi:alcohol dehydrogenase class IV